MNLKKWIASIALFIVGVGFIVYPKWAAGYAEKHRSEIVTEYDQKVEQEDRANIDALFSAAQEYNASLANYEIDLFRTEEAGYFEQLILPGTDVMAYLRIPKLGLTLPVYHGASDESLTRGCGHMKETSLPVGGESSHAIITAHTGMASSPMFSDLPLLSIGDIFFVDVLGQTLTYEVQSPEDINIIEPTEGSYARIRPGEDIVTLLTCYPINVNSHRLLVTGHRIETPENEEVVIEQIVETREENGGESLWVENYNRAITVGIIVSALTLLLFVVLRIFLAKANPDGGSNG